MELTRTKGQGGRNTAQEASHVRHAPGAKNGVYVNLRGRFAGQQDRARACMAMDPGKTPARAGNGKAGQQGWKAGRGTHARHSSQERDGSGHGGHGPYGNIRHGHSMYGREEEYSSTCCGKCRYFLRKWRGGVWICSNEESGKGGFPTNYSSTCPLFAREDWSRDAQGRQKAHGKRHPALFYEGKTYEEEKEGYMPCSQLLGN